MNKTKNKTYWPQGIIASILFIITACGITIKIALDNPVQMDSSYMTKYQQVDENINELLLAQKRFDEKFTVNIDKTKISMGKNSIALIVKKKNSNESVSNAKIEMLITRPETEEFDIKLGVRSIENGVYTFDQFNINKIGRWQIVAKVTIGEDYGYYKNEVLAIN